MTSLVPFHGHRSMSRPVGGGIFDDPFFRSFFDMNDAFSTAAFRVDVKDKGDRFQLDAELPGVEPEKINLTVDNGVMTIAADMNEEKKEERENYVFNERRVGHFQRSFNLEGIAEEGISAEYKHGVLHVNLPKEKPEERKTQRKINIQ